LAADSTDFVLGNSTFVLNNAEDGAWLGSETECGAFSYYSLIAFNEGTTLVDGSIWWADFACTDIFGNQGGDWVGPLEGLEAVNGNMSSDPLFCDTAAGDFHIDFSSPCAGECDEWQ
jgi:hypothetical protein